MIRRALTLNNASPAQIMQYRIAQVIKRYQTSPLDSGNAAIQGSGSRLRFLAATLSERVVHLMMQLEKNRKDSYLMRQFMILLRRRRVALNYLRRDHYYLYTYRSPA